MYDSWSGIVRLFRRENDVANGWLTLGFLQALLRLHINLTVYKLLPAKGFYPKGYL
jgi:hypothetical protein